jgi:hypothetical protein
MPTISDFETPVKLNDYYSKQLLDGKLALFLGAGVSIDFGLPSWPELLKRLYASKRDTPPKKKTEKQQADLFKQKYYINDDKGYKEAIRKALYKKADLSFNNLRKNVQLSAIAAIIMASHRGNASEVITLNFDDVLEIYLEYHGFVTNSVGNEMFWKRQADVTIYHPHGFIPSRHSLEISNNIVLDQLSYSKIVGDPTNPWRQQLLSTMRTHTCIFIGLSGNDDNLDSLLVSCKDQHISKNESTLYWGVSFVKQGDIDTKSLWESRGIFCLEVSDYNQDISDFLFGICQNAAKLRFQP